MFSGWADSRPEVEAHGRARPGGQRSGKARQVWRSALVSSRDLRRIKLCVGADSLADLREWMAARMPDAAAGTTLAIPSSTIALAMRSRSMRSSGSRSSLETGNENAGLR